MVTTPSVSADLAKTQSDPSERARAISQELLSLPVIAQVAKEEGLLTGTGDEDVIAGIRARTSVSLPPKTLVSRSDPDTFVVSYAGPTADEAQRVTNRLLKVFIERDGSNRRTRAKETAAFLGEQLRDSERRMDEVEARLRRLKESNTGLLPDQALANLQAMSDIRQRSDNNAEALRDERDRLAAVEQQLEAARREVAADTRTPEEIAADERVGKLEQAARRGAAQLHREAPGDSAAGSAAGDGPHRPGPGQDAARRRPGAPRRRPIRRSPSSPGIATACGRGSASCRRSRAACRRSSPPISRASTRRRSSSSSWRRSSRPTSWRRRSTSGWPSATRRR